MTKTNRNRILKWIAKWKPRLLIGDWAVITEFESCKCEENPKYLATTGVNTSYREARIQIYSPYWEESIATQEQIIVHELIHIMTWPLRETLHKAVCAKVIRPSKLEELDEGNTNYIAKVVYKYHTRNRKTPKEYIV